ncbi:1586_t:CDS:1, partial [Acaulospora morrowiae]
DVVLKIRPYCQILEIQLWMDITSKAMAPNIPISSTITPARKLSSIQLPTRNVTSLQQVKISSEIITTKQAEKIISWINEKKSYDASEFYYEFELIL